MSHYVDMFTICITALFLWGWAGLWPCTKYGCPEVQKQLRTRCI